MKECCGPTEKPALDASYRRILWIALVANAVMFVAEFASSFFADSVSLQADSIDFLGDAGNYAISLYVLSRSLRARAIASVIKGSSMGLFGVWVLCNVAYKLYVGASPEAPVMTLMGILALAVNVSVALMLFRYREGDSNMESVWLCTRNDAIGNIAVLFAAAGVYFTNTMWPDLAVALVIGYLGISASVRVLKKARSELSST